MGWPTLLLASELVPQRDSQRVSTAECNHGRVLVVGVPGDACTGTYAASMAVTEPSPKPGAAPALEALPSDRARGDLAGDGAAHAGGSNSDWAERRNVVEHSATSRRRSAVRAGRMGDRRSAEAQDGASEADTEHDPSSLDRTSTGELGGAAEHGDEVGGSEWMTRELA